MKNIISNIKFILKKTILFDIVRFYRRIFAKEHEIINLLKPNSLIFDIGANYGEKSMPFIKRNFRILMVEPNYMIIDFLRKHYAKYSLVKILQNAVGKKKGKKYFYVSTKNPAISTLDENYRYNKRFLKFKYDLVFTVNLVTLDYLIQKFGNPDYIKIDTENYEYQVISGLSKKTGIISFEFIHENIDTVKKIFKKLIKLGYNEFNFSEAENSYFYYKKFKKKNQISDLLEDIKKNSLKNSEFWGDIYAK